VGTHVAKGAVVLVVESEKAEVEIEAPAAGVLRHVYVEVDRTVPCGTVLAALTVTADEPFDADAFRRAHDRPEKAVASVAVPPRGAGVAPVSAPRPDAPVTPAARALAKARGIDVAAVAGTGPGGRVTREDVEAHVAAREGLVDVGGGVSLEVFTQGQGETIVLIPGFGSDVSVFAPLVPALAERHRVLGVNPRGIGRSEAPGDPVYDVETVAHEVLGAAGGEPVHLIGASLGAAVAIDAALVAPGRVRSLTLITPFLDASPRLLAVVDAWCRVRAEASPAALAAMLLPWFCSAGFLGDARARERAVRGLTDMVARVPVASLQRSAAGLRAWSGRRHAALARLALPALVVGGTEDLLAPDARDVADAIPGASFVAVGGAGHAVALEAADVVTRVILEHLAGGRGEA
jgi:pyruvate dehydrogenase E2 component (dihydrolipoamide acetyltransferase)